MAAFYAERAKGGAGLIVTGGVAPNREGWVLPMAGKMSTAKENVPPTAKPLPAAPPLFGTNAKVPSPRTGGRLGGNIPISMSMSLDSGLPRLQMLSLSTSAA